MLRRRRLKLPKTPAATVPEISSQASYFETGTNYFGSVQPHKYRFSCLPCDVRWSDENKVSKCWQCGKKKEARGGF